MKVLANGYFSDKWEASHLSLGLRNSDRVPRNTKTLTRCDGCVGVEGLLSNLDPLDLSSICDNDLVVKDDFPFPQIFTLDSLIIVCNRDSILEFNPQTLSLVSKFVTLSNGGLWSVASSQYFVYLTNGLVSLSRDPYTHRYSYANAPICSTVCNFNGQIICGNIKNTYLKYNGEVLYNGIATHSGRL